MQKKVKVIGVILLLFSSQLTYAQEAMNETKFWSLIEAAWEGLPDSNKKRLNAVATNDKDILEQLDLGGECLAMIKKLEKILKKLNKEDLTEFTHILEKKLYQIDRQDIHEYTDGSEDFFLYCRGFIVCLGQQYYEMIDKDPSKATFDLACEIMCFVGYRVYEEKFDLDFEMGKYHNIETFSNQAGW